MATLYEITGDFLKLLDMAEELDEEVFRDTLEGIEGELHLGRTDWDILRPGVHGR